MERLEKEFKIENLGHPDSLKCATLQFVVQENYDRAGSELRHYQQIKSTYPLYKDRTNRYFDHAVEIIEAIRTKKAVPLNNLPAAKRQEINGRIFAHFHELKDTLQRISDIEYDLRLQDAKSTVWVIKAFSICLFIIVSLSVFNEAYQSLRTPLHMLLREVAEWILLKMGI